ncbi:MAG TPA: XRE family transcriptional regulator [Flavobacteriaceae bacterium]|nr:XRE family transcriptional regulator [Flavobacteriaceae bacterium]
MINNSDINERVLQLIEYKSGNNQKKFAESIGFAPQVISNIVSGRKSKPSYDVLNAIITSFVDINSEWLLTGEGSMLKDGSDDIYIQPLSNNRKAIEAKIEEQVVPLYSLTAEAGLKDLFDSGVPSQVLDTIKIPNLPRCDGAITITGDSMYPLLKSGDMVLYAITRPENIFYGEMYLLGIQLNDFEEFITVKYIHKSQNKDHIILASQNKHHDDKEIPLSSIRSIALVKASIRINTML